MNNFNEQTIIGGLKSLGPKPLKVVKTWVPGFYTDEEFINFINKSEHLYIVDGKVEYIEHKNLNDESENFVHSDKSNIKEQNFSKTITNLNNNYIKLELDSDLLYTSPMQYVIDKEVYENSKGTWIHLFYNLIDFFDKHEPVIFCKYIDYINNKSLNNYNFIDTFISDIQTRYIKSQKKYLFRSGHEGSEEISRWILDMLSFFNYKSRCSIYGTKKNNKMSIDTEIDKKQETNISSQNELCVSIENSITKSEIEDNKEKISEYLELFLNSDLSYTNPKQYYIDDTLFDNKFGTWRGLFTNIVSYLANKDPKKFIQYAEIINTKSIDNYYFSKNSLPDKDVIFIKVINQYVVFHGSASFIGKQLFELLRFFGYSDKYKIYGVKRDSSKEYQAKNHPLEKQNIDTFDDILDIIEIYNEKVENDFKEKIKTCSCFEPLIKYVKKKCIEEKNFEFLSEKLDNSIAYINFKTKRGIRDFAICEFFDEETEEKINKYIKDNDLDCIHVRCIIKTHEPNNEFISISEVPKDKLTIFFEKPFLYSTTIKILRIEE